MSKSCGAEGRRMLGKYLILAIAILMGSNLLKAQENGNGSRPVIGFYNFEIGRKYALSTYLSPLQYSGTNYALSGYWTKVLPSNPEHLSMSFDTRVNYGDFLNNAHTAREIDFHADFRWGLEWQKRLPSNFIVSVGGETGLYGGLLYLVRNGNNPVSAQFAVGVGLKAGAGWHTQIGKLPILISERLSIPMFGGFFMPNYGETYYEIYLGNRSGLAHFGWPGNRPGVENLLSVTLDFGRTAMQIGYRFSYQNEKENHLTTRLANHAFVIGVVPGGIGLKKKQSDIITPLY